MTRSHLGRANLIVLACLMWMPDASADNQSLLDAERFAARGRLASVAGAHTTAGAAFEKAFHELADPAYLFAAGEAYVEATAWASAARVYAVLVTRPLPKEEAALAKSELEAASAQLEGIRSRLAVHISPPGAQVEVDGLALTFGNPATTWVEAGQHVVRVEYPGFQTVEKVVEVSLENPAVVHVDLERIAGGIGTLQVSSTVPGAMVYINDSAVGPTPIGILQRPQGIYDIRIEKEGYNIWERSVSVQKDLPTEVVAKLEEGPGLAPVAAVAVAAAPTPAPQAATMTPAVAPALVPLGAAAAAPAVKEVPLAIIPAETAPALEATSEVAPALIAVPEEAPALVEAPAIVPQEAPPLVIQSAEEAFVEETPVPAPVVVEETVEAEPVEEYEASSFADEEYSSDIVESESSGGGGDPMLIGLGWGLAGLGAAVAGAGYYFTMEAATSAEKRDSVPLELPEGGEYNPGGQYSPDNEQHVQYWQESLFLYYWNEADTEAKANTMLSYVMYGSGGAILVTGVTLAIMGHMDSGGGEYAEMEGNGPRWTGIQTGPTKDGWVFSSGLRF